MKSTLKLLKQEFESSSGLTPQFAHFAKTAKREITKELKRLGAEDINISRGHFYLSGFFRRGEQWWYFSMSDVRFFPGTDMLVRTAEGPKDYHGGSNQYLKWSLDMFELFFHGK